MSHGNVDDKEQQLMNRHSRRALLGTLTILLIACDSGQETGVLARAEDFRLTIDQAAELLTNQSQLPNQPEIVEALADLWIDYSLLATAAVEDSLLESIDLTPLVRDEVEQELVYRLRDEVIVVDTVVTEEELQSLWERAGPEGQVRARHILLGVPSGASEVQRDSVRALAAQLAERARDGEDFSALAQEFSQDRGSAALGGDLGTFGRGDMVGPFEEAAFGLEPGEVSDPVETIYGFHVILLDQKDIQSLDDAENRLSFLAEVRASRTAVAESIYIAGIEEPANVQLESGAIAAMRELARRPGQRLSRRAAARPLTTFEGGTFTAQDFQQFIQSRPPAFRSQIPEADSAALDGLVRTLTRGELLVRAAESQGFEMTEQETDSMMDQARNRFFVAAAQLGLVGIVPSEGQTNAEAIQERVTTNLTEILQGRRDVIPLGVISYALRQKYRGELYEQAVPEVVSRVEAMGGTPPPQAPGSTAPAPNAPPPVPDSTPGASGR
jgi:parvulin-like peptidyl-prolyl isomerase